MSSRRGKRGHESPEYKPHSFASIITIDLLSDSEDSATCTDYKKSRKSIEGIDDNDDIKPASITMKTSIRTYSILDKDKHEIIELLDDNDEHVKPTSTAPTCVKQDYVYAQKLQEDEERGRPKRKNLLKEQRLAMNETIMGKSILLVERIIEVVSSLSTSNELLNAMDVKPVAKDDMVFIMERMLNTLATYQALGYMSHVDTGFHYTSEGNMAHIRTYGLMSKHERSSQQIEAVRNRASAYGDGIYTANNPIKSKGFGAIGLLVARLQGVSVRVAQFPNPLVKGEDVQKATTIVGNITHGRSNYRAFCDEIVLKSSSQCVPLLQYNQNMSLRHIVHLQTVMQSMLNEYLNDQLSA
jgi:hypothetical protein